MNRRRKIALAALGLIAAITISIPLIQRLSIELVQLQIREQYLVGTSTLSEIAENMAVPYDELVARLPLEGLSPGIVRKSTIAELSKKIDEPLPVFKHQIVDAVFAIQFKNANVWNAWGWVSSTDDQRVSAK